MAGFLARGIQLAPAVGLWVNNVLPDVGFTLASLVEATFPGYSRVVVGPATAELVLPGGGARLTFTDAVFRATGGLPQQIVFGYFTVQLDWLAVPRLLWVERMQGVAKVPTVTDVIKVSPVWDFSTLFSGG